MVDGRSGCQWWLVVRGWYTIYIYMFSNKRIYIKRQSGGGGEWGTRCIHYLMASPAHTLSALDDGSHCRHIPGLSYSNIHRISEVSDPMYQRSSHMMRRFTKIHILYAFNTFTTNYNLQLQSATIGESSPYKYKVITTVPTTCLFTNIPLQCYVSKYYNSTFKQML